MGEANTVYVLIGQRGSGKTYYGQRLKYNQPELSIVSRDEILMRIFGSVYLSPYSSDHELARKITSRLLRRKLSIRTGVVLVLDLWVGDSPARRNLVDKLREFGATRVVALYFVTRLEMVNQWFWLKPGIAKISEMKTRKGEGLTFFSESAPANDYEIFHKNASQIDSDGFDEVIRVDPEKDLIFLT